MHSNSTENCLEWFFKSVEWLFVVPALVLGNDPSSFSDISASFMLRGSASVLSKILRYIDIVGGSLHWKKPRLPSICRTRAGLDLYCRLYGGRCQTRTDTCRPAPCQPSGSKHVPVRHWPVLDQTGRPTGRQDCLPGRHMLRHCYSGRSQAGTNDMYL
jgi:hypothetical protein